MRKIKFDSETINQIKDFAKEHTLMETCNKFTLKPDTLRRVAKENGVSFVQQRNIKISEVSDEIKSVICGLYENTNMSINAIRAEVHIKNDTLYDILKENYTEECRNNRKSKLYRLSKLGAANPMYGKTGDEHPTYKGIVEDGKGYLMCLKPDWYTGRSGSIHVFLHSVIMCQALGLTEIPKGYCVHHIDGNPRNNDISNLALMTIDAHAKLHAIMRNLCKVQRSAKCVG